MHFERRNAFQKEYNNLFFEKKNMYVPTLPDPLPEIHLFFYLA